MSRFKVINGVNSIGAPPAPAPTINLKAGGSHGNSHYGSMLSPISGAIPPDRSIHMPPALATRLHDMVAPAFARTIEKNTSNEHIKTNKHNHRNTSS